MGCNTSKRTGWNVSPSRLQKFDVCKSRSKALMEDFDNIYQNNHRSRRGPPPRIDYGAQEGRTAFLNLPHELAGISEPNRYPRFPTAWKEPDYKPHRQVEFSVPHRNQAILRAQKPEAIKPRSRHRKNHPPLLRPEYKPDNRSHHRPEAQTWLQQHPIRDSRSRPQAKIHERHSPRSRGLGRPIPQHHGWERVQVTKPSIESYYQVSLGERHSGRPHRAQWMGHGGTVLRPSPRPHRRKINPHTTLKQEPRASYHYPKIGVLNIYV